MTLFTELKRRNVIRVGAAYAVLAWLLAQVADLLLDTFGAPEWALQAIVIALLLGLPVVLVFAWVFEVTPEGIKRETEVDRSRSVTSETGRRLDRVIMVVLLLAVGYFAVDKFVLSSRPPAGMDGEMPGVAATTETSDHSIGVLPFVNMSDDEGNDYFSDGLSEELLNVLARNPELQVAARTSSFSLRDEKLSIAEIAERLDVAHVLEGSVRKSGDRVRITAQLIRADNGYHLWSETWDRDLDDIFEVQDEIANKITAALLPHIIGDSAAASAGYTPSPDAYQRYLLARDHLNERTVPGTRNAYEIAKELTRDYPDYPAAHALFAHAAFLNSRRTGGHRPWIVAEPEARRALERALALDPKLAEPFLVEGRLHALSHEPREAIPFFQRAIEINPSYAEAYRYLSEAWMDIGEEALAFEALEKALELDPISVSALTWAIRQATASGNTAIADKHMDILRQLAPQTADDLQFHLFWEQDENARAAIALENFRADWPEGEPHDGHLASLYAQLGLVDEAMSITRGAKMLIAAEMGNRQLALDTMDEIIRERTDPHDRADTLWMNYVTLDMYDEALDVLSELWYGYAGEDLGPRMDTLDVAVFIQLLRRAGREDEARPIIEMYLENESVQLSHPEYNLALVAGEYDAAMEALLRDAREGRFDTRYTDISPWLFPLESHPDYPELVALFEAWREEQRALYDRLSAERDAETAAGT